MWFYQHSDEVAGFHYDGSTFTQFGSPLAGSVTAAASIPAVPLQVYAIQAGSNTLSISSDSGYTWTQRAITALSSSTAEVYSLWAPAVGQVYLVSSRGNVPANTSLDGIWRTLDDGVTWTRIVALSVTESLFGIHLAFGLTKLFYTVCTANPSTTPTWEFRRCNFDGTGVETLASHTFSSAPHFLLLRAIADDFVLATDFDPQNLVLKIDASGMAVMTPSGLGLPYDALPLTASEWLTVGTPSIFDSDVRVYRTTDAGTTWTLTKTIVDVEGFGINARPNSYFMLSAPQPATSSDLVMLGNVDYNVQQLFWTSTDAGLTWVQLLNTADPNPTEASRSPGGLASVCPVSAAPRVAVPSRLATIVG